MTEFFKCKVGDVLITFPRESDRAEGFGDVVGIVTEFSYEGITVKNSHLPGTNFVSHAAAIAAGYEVFTDQKLRPYCAVHARSHRDWYESEQWLVNNLRKRNLVVHCSPLRYRKVKIGSWCERYVQLNFDGEYCKYPSEVFPETR